MNTRLQGRLLVLAALFLCLYALGLSLSPAVQARSWDAELLWKHWIGAAAWGLVFGLAYREMRRRLPEGDPYILPGIALLSGWGLLTVWRLSPAFGLRQTAWLVFSGLVFTAGLRLAPGLGILRRYKYLLLSSGLLLTALTLIFGTNPAGAGPRLWLGCCGVYFQPSEPLKLLLVIFLAAYLADRPSARLQTLTLLFPVFLLSGTAMLLVVVQRDLGTASILITLQALMLFLATGQKRVLALSALALCAAGLVGYFYVDIIHTRLDIWLNPWADPAGNSYQIVQSLLAAANGGLLGRGPGLGSPAVVPVAISDFIFSAIAEETGFLGTTALLVLITALVVRGFHIAQNAAGRFPRLLASGVATYLAVQTILIVGGNLRLLPLTGVTLPFLSYGGSSLLTSFLAALLVLLPSENVDFEPAPLPRPQPISALAGLLMLGLAGLMAANGWWAVVRGPDLLTRTDNPRRTIADRYVQRGSLLDRNNLGITVTRGVTAGFYRAYLYPDLGPVTGYTQPTYGQAGLEASLDDYLRGLKGNPASLVWWHHLLYGQPPAGLDVRLSIDIKLQKQADSLLGEHAGALVLLDAKSGEILVMASHPTYDPNRLDEIGQSLLSDERAPLVNRAAQGKYPAGTALGPFLLSGTGSQLPELPQSFAVELGGRKLDCTHPPTDEADWAYAVTNGCPAALQSLGRQIGTGGLLSLFERLGFYTAPQARLPAATPAERQIEAEAGEAVLSETLKVSPLQMALAAAALSNDGLRPGPRLAMAVDTPSQGWVVLPALSEPVQVYPAGATGVSLPMLTAPGQAAWQSSGQAGTGGQPVCWYLSGTPPGWQGTPLAVAVLLEEDNPELAEHIGQSVLQAALSQKPETGR